MTQKKRVEKFNPYHDPANGRFTFGPGGEIETGPDAGGGEGDSEGEITEPGLEPVYPVETLLGILTGGGALRALGRVLGIFGREATGNAIENAAKAIEEYFGGKPDRTFPNKAGDIVMMKGDKKIRFDINDFSPHGEPHFHVEKETPSGDWVDAGDQHYYPFKKE